MQDSNSKFLPPNRFRETSYAVKSTNRDFLNSRNLSRVPVNFTTNPLADEDHVNLLNSMGCSRAAIRGSHSSSDQFLSAQLQEDSCSSSSSASSCGSFNDRDVDNLQGCYYTDRDVLLTTQHSDDKDTTALLCEKNSWFLFFFKWYKARTVNSFCFRNVFQLSLQHKWPLIVSLPQKSYFFKN